MSKSLLGNTSDVSDRVPMPVFGERVPDQRYVVRPGAYAIIQDDAGLFALVVTPEGICLPGGGIELGETPEQAVIREVLEECGLGVRPGERFAEAVQLVYGEAEDTYFEKRCVFLRAALTGERCAPLELDHELVWRSAEAAVRALRPPSQVWALDLAARRRRSAGN